MGIGNSELGRLDTTELRILRGSWEDIMENIGENGPYIFGRFLKKYNYFSYFKRFSNLSADGIADDIAFKDHSFLVMSSINNFVLHTGTDDQLRSDLCKLGRMHRNKNLSSQQFLELKSIIVDIMDKKFRLPLETLKIWSKAFDICYFYVFQELDENESSSAQAYCQ